MCLENSSLEVGEDISAPDFVFYLRSSSCLALFLSALCLGFGVESQLGSSSPKIKIKERPDYMTKFVIYEDRAGEYRWRLVASNGEIVATSEGYSVKSSAKRSAEKVRVWASNATIVEE